MTTPSTHRQKRTAITSNVEEYLETIYRLEREKGVVRVKEISGELGVSYASTSEILRRMTALELVHHERYGYVRLTDKGISQAETIIKRRRCCSVSSIRCCACRQSWHPPTPVGWSTRCLTASLSV